MEPAPSGITAADAATAYPADWDDRLARLRQSMNAAGYSPLEHLSEVVKPDGAEWLATDLDDEPWILRWHSAQSRVVSFRFRDGKRGSPVVAVRLPAARRAALAIADSLKTAPQEQTVTTPATTTITVHGTDAGSIRITGCEGAGTYPASRYLEFSCVLAAPDGGRLYVGTEYCDTWSVQVAMTDAGSPLPPWPLALSQGDGNTAPRDALVLTIEAPEGTKVVNPCPAS